MQCTSGLLHGCGIEKLELHKNAFFTFLTVFVCGSVSLMKNRQYVCSNCPKSFLLTVVLPFQSSEHLQTAGHSGDGTEGNTFCCLWILCFITLKLAGESFLHPCMPQEGLQWINTLKSRNDTTEDYRAGTNPYGTLGASPYFFTKTNKLASLLRKKSDPAYINAENMLQRRFQGMYMCQVQFSKNISQRGIFSLIYILLIHRR